MTNPIRVTCAINKYGKPGEMVDVTGDLIEITTQSAVPVGLVILDEDSSFQCVPLEFIHRV